eukprot:gnl/Chilomastix_cuspidata/2644.p1 GENE.gnl/Chilomastix_cuspidata/2644~~gnl/Chilomastix_cuspidata/2644.p1  ORF type:complete len:1269 (-),score=620.20 gnl/Chilomastix_cuspidata/2644:49-3855(-)
MADFPAAAGPASTIRSGILEICLAVRFEPKRALILETWMVARALAVFAALLPLALLTTHQATQDIGFIFFNETGTETIDVDTVSIVTVHITQLGMILGKQALYVIAYYTDTGGNSCGTDDFYAGYSLRSKNFEASLSTGCTIDSIDIEVYSEDSYSVSASVVYVIHGVTVVSEVVPYSMDGWMTVFPEFASAGTYTLVYLVKDPDTYEFLNFGVSVSMGGAVSIQKDADGDLFGAAGGNEVFWSNPIGKFIALKVDVAAASTASLVSIGPNPYGEVPDDTYSPRLIHVELTDDEGRDYLVVASTSAVVESLLLTTYQFSDAGLEEIDSYEVYTDFGITGPLMASYDGLYARTESGGMVFFVFFELSIDEGALVFDTSVRSYTHVSCIEIPDVNEETGTYTFCGPTNFATRASTFVSDAVTMHILSVGDEGFMVWNDFPASGILDDFIILLFASHSYKCFSGVKLGADELYGDEFVFYCDNDHGTGVCSFSFNEKLAQFDLPISIGSTDSDMSCELFTHRDESDGVTTYYMSVGVPSERRFYLITVDDNYFGGCDDDCYSFDFSMADMKERIQIFTAGFDQFGSQIKLFPGFLSESADLRLDSAVLAQTNVVFLRLKDLYDSEQCTYGSVGTSPCDLTDTAFSALFRVFPDVFFASTVTVSLEYIQTTHIAEIEFSVLEDGAADGEIIFTQSYNSYSGSSVISLFTGCDTTQCPDNAIELEFGNLGLCMYPENNTFLDEGAWVECEAYTCMPGAFSEYNTSSSELQNNIRYVSNSDGDEFYFLSAPTSEDTDLFFQLLVRMITIPYISDGLKAFKVILSYPFVAGLCVALLVIFSFVFRNACGGCAVRCLRRMDVRKDSFAAVQPGRDEYPLETRGHLVTGIFSIIIYILFVYLVVIGALYYTRENITLDTEVTTFASAITDDQELAASLEVRNFTFRAYFLNAADTGRAVRPYVYISGCYESESSSSDSCVVSVTTERGLMELDGGGDVSYLLAEGAVTGGDFEDEFLFDIIFEEIYAAQVLLEFEFGVAADDGLDAAGTYATYSTRVNRTLLCATTTPFLTATQRLGVSLVPTFLTNDVYPDSMPAAAVLLAPSFTEITDCNAQESFTSSVDPIHLSLAIAREEAAATYYTYRRSIALEGFIVMLLEAGLTVVGLFLILVKLVALIVALMHRIKAWRAMRYDATFAKATSAKAAIQPADVSNAEPASQGMLEVPDASRIQPSQPLTPVDLSSEEKFSSIYRVNASSSHSPVLISDVSSHASSAADIP